MIKTLRFSASAWLETAIASSGVKFIPFIMTFNLCFKSVEDIYH